MLASTRRAIARFDLAADSAFERLRGNRTADRVFYAASELGDFSLVWLLLAAARGLRSERDEKAAVRVAVAAAAESALVNGLVKSLFRRTRPPWDVVRPHRLRRPLTSSFPSGHASAAVSNAILLSEDDPLWPAYVAVAAVVASSRVYVKIHHASDVLAGAGLGVVLGLVGRKVMPLPPHERAAGGSS
ncbi:MAG TPA: phosphatase PAP2 family protein [Acidimicrobiales bacterium]|nr:phosphatase PAP2 family protein [Acidimicrobiales bacterium]